MSNDITKRTSANHAYSNLRRSSVLLAAAGALASVLTACDTRSDSTRAIQAGSNKLSALTGGGTAPASVESTDKAMNLIISTVQSATTDSDPKTAAAALLLTSQAHFGLAEGPADNAMRLDREVRRGFDKANNLASSWTALNAAAAAAEAFNPASTIAEFNQTITSKRQESTAERAALREIKSRIDALDTQRKAAQASAEQIQSQYAVQMDSIRGMSAIAATPIVEKAQELWRQAEKLRLDAARLTAQIEVLGPEATSRATVADQFDKQVVDLTGAIAELEARKQIQSRTAAAARTEAQTIAGTLDQTIFDAGKRLNDEVIPAYATAISTFEKAARASASAEAASPVAARISTGSARQSIAELYWNTAQAHAYSSRVLDTLTSNTPSLPNASDYANRAKASRDAAKVALDQARENYGQAERAFSSAPAQGSSRERLQKLGELLSKAAQVTEGKSIDLGNSFGFKGVSVAPERDRVSEAKLMMTAYNVLIAEGKFDEALGMVVGDEDAVAAYRTSNQLSGVANRLDTAIKNKFPGKSLADGLGQLSAMGINADTLKGVQDVNTLEFKANEDGTVSVTNPAMPTMPISLRDINGVWKLDVNPLKPMLAQAAMMMGPLTTVFGAVADDVEAGKFDTVEAVGADLMAKLQKAMMDAMSGGMGGG